jgi:hypothetical protein
MGDIMPNWCNNTLYVSGDKKEIKKFKRFVSDKKTNSDLSFNKILPVPKILMRYSKSYGDFPDKKSYNKLLKEYYVSLKKYKEKLKENPEDTSLYKPAKPLNQEIHDSLIEKHGASNWYDWNIKFWGTKWDIDGEGCLTSEMDNELVYQFSTAWSPCEPIVHILSNKFPELNFNFFYDEGGAGFAGHLEIEKNEIIGDYYHEYPNESYFQYLLDEQHEGDYESFMEYYEDCDDHIEFITKKIHGEKYLKNKKAFIEVLKEEKN